MLSVKVWQVKLLQQNLSRFTEKTAGTLYRRIHTLHPNMVIAWMTAWDHFLVAFLMMLQKSWSAAFTSSKSGGNKVFANLFVEAIS